MYLFYSIGFYFVVVFFLLFCFLFLFIFQYFFTITFAGILLLVAAVIS